ncbi:hypothetical protein HYT25_04000 [Candidatus Pacearchaeota archaeon]|nr:hypothetical protein [Candidatus Pacearchaeota archaeon]
MKSEHKKIIAVFILILGIVAIASVLTYRTGNVVSGNRECSDTDHTYIGGNFNAESLFTQTATTLFERNEGYARAIAQTIDSCTYVFRSLRLVPAVREGYCTIDGSRNLAITVRACSKGCSNGACVR